MVPFTSGGSRLAELSPGLGKEWIEKDPGWCSSSYMTDGWVPPCPC